jgi:t-SNARE complex subunit (syntaxin)
LLLVFATSFNQFDRRLGNNEVLKQLKGPLLEDAEVNLGFRDKARGMLDDIEAGLVSIRQQLERFVSNNDGTIDKQTKEQIAVHFRHISQVVVRANHFFDLVFRSIEERKAENGDVHFQDSSLRILNFLAILLRRKFDLAIKKMNCLQLNVAFEYQKKIERTLKIYKADLSPKEIKDLSSDPQKMNHFIQEYMMMSPQFEDAVREIDERLGEIKELEKNMNRLLGLIKELHNVVKQQNVVVDSITQTMDNIQDHSERTFTEMESAKAYQVSSKQKMFLLFVIVLIVAIGMLNWILGFIIK